MATARSGTVLRCTVQNWILHRRRVMMAVAAGQPEPARVCVHAPTPAELHAARGQLQHAGDMLAQQGEPQQACVLEYCDAAGGAALHPAHCGTLDVRRFFAALDTLALGRVLLTAAEVPSTQAVVQANAAKLPDGLVLVADRQLGGKGRGGNAWHSPNGCLMFSTCTRLAVEGPRLPFVQYLVSLAVVQAVQAEAAAALGSAGGGSAAAAVDVRIKWPNDIYAGGLKVGGILCHSSYREQRFHVVVGVGLNVANRQPTTCLDALVEQEAFRRGLPTPAPLSREALLAGIMTRLEPMLALLCTDGFAPFERDYYAAWLHSGQRVELEESATGEAPRRVGLVVRGLTTHGYLRAEDGGGESYELHPDGNSLDFFQGLVRKKLPAA